jgi:hypothetical protein
MFCFGFQGILSAQSPEKFNYQAVVRDASGNVLASQSVNFRMSILQGSVDGAAVYVETHTTTSNAHGQVTLSIGSGSPVSGTFTGISWAGSSHFLKTEMDAAGGTSYVLMGTTQLLSVPYALYAKTSGSGISLADTDVDTKIQVEETSDEDIIRFDVAGAEKFKVDATGLVLPQTTGSSTGVIYKGPESFIHNYKPSANDGYNTFIGINAGNFAMMSGDYPWKASKNTALGHSCLNSNTTGYENTAVGCSSLLSNTIGYSNTALGNGSLQSNTVGNFNVSIGSSSLSLNTTGDENTALGNVSLFFNTIGSRNTAVGTGSLMNNTTASENVAIGNGSLGTQSYNNSGNNWNSRNTAIGSEALYSNETTSTSAGINNVAIGYRAGFGSEGSNGFNNIFIGYQAGDNVSSGSSNIILGYDIDLPLASGNSQMVLGNANTLYGDLQNNRIGIGTTTPHAPLQFGNYTGNRKIVLYEDANNDHQYFGFGINTAAMRYQIAGTNSDHIFFAGNGSSSSNELARIKGNGTLRVSSLSTNGPVYSNNNILTNTNPSDRNLKENIVPIGNSMDKVMALNPVTYTWKSNGAKGIGFIAQEVEEVIPELVNTNDDGTKGIYSLEMIPYLVKALQEQQILIEDLKNRIQHLENQPQ